MGMLIGQDSPYAAERRKWEAQHSEWGAPGKPFVFQEYPVMLSKASHPKQGGPPLFEDRIAADANKERNLLSRGFVRGHDKAVESLEAVDLNYAKLSAEREAEKRRMSARAVAEVERFEDRSVDHQPTIPEQPIRRRGARTPEELQAVGA